MEESRYTNACWCCRVSGSALIESVSNVSNGRRVILGKKIKVDWEYDRGILIINQGSEKHSGMDKTIFAVVKFCG